MELFKTAPYKPAIGFEKVEYLNFEGLYPPIVKMFNFKMEIDPNRPTKKFGKTYIFLTDFYFWHQIQDEAIQYDIIKKYIPDVKIVFMNQFNIDDGLKNNILGELPDELTNEQFFILMKKLRFGNLHDSPYESHPYIEGIHDKYKMDAHDEQFQEMFKFNFEFEEVYLLKRSVSTMHLLSPLCFQQHGEAPWFYDNKLNGGTNEYNSWEMEGLYLFTQRFKKDLVLDPNSPKKIFLSRKDANNRYAKMFKEKNELPNTLAWSQNRYFEDEDMFENYFVSKGYVPVIMESLSYIDQINLFYNATHVAGLIGSGMLNTIFSKDLKYLFSIHVNPKYFFSYGYCCWMHGAEYVEIDFRSICEDKEAMLKELDGFKDKY